MKKQFLLLSLLLLPGLSQADEATPPPDITRTQLGTALINYQAAALMQEYQLNQQLIFMAAPGTDWAVAAGTAVGSASVNAGTVGASLYDNNLLRSLSVFSVATSITYNGATAKPHDTRAGGPTQIYQTMKPFLLTGDAGSLPSFDVSTLTHLNKIDPAVAQQLINNITDPFPTADSKIISDLQTMVSGGGELNGADQEALGTKIMEQVLISMSASALGDIASRRIINNANPSAPTIMETMDNYSQQRFTNPDWTKAMSASSEQAMIREIAHMTAYSIWLQYQQFKISEQQLALLASMNVVLAKMNAAIDNLNQQMSSAKAQGAAAVTPSPVQQ